MVTKEYAMAYTEVVEILKHVSDEDVKKIPEEKLEFYKSNMDNEYKYKIDITKKFEEQEMSDITKAILANIFRDYWATPYQKERILAKEKYDLNKLEEEKETNIIQIIYLKTTKEYKQIVKSNYGSDILLFTPIMFFLPPIKFKFFFAFFLFYLFYWIYKCMCIMFKIFN